MERLYGKFRGRVSDNADPEKFGRVRVRVPELFDDVESDWAWPSFPVGTVQRIPPINTGVWVEFEQGLQDRPIYTGAWSYAPDGISSLPNLAKGEDDGSEYGRGDSAESHETGPDGNPIKITEVPSTEVGQYPDVIETKTPGGHRYSVDDRPGQQREAYQHPSGSYRETQPEGSVNEKVMGSRRLVVLKNAYQHVVGAVTEVFEKQVTRTFKSVLKTSVARDSEELVGREKHESYGKLKQELGSGERTVAGSFVDNILGQATQSVGGSRSSMIAERDQKIVVEIDRETIMGVSPTASRSTLAKRFTCLNGAFGVTVLVPSINLLGPYAIILGDESGMLTADLLPALELPVATVGSVHLGTSVGNVELVTWLGFVLLGQPVPGVPPTSPAVKGAELSIVLAALGTLLAADTALTPTTKAALTAWALTLPTMLSTKVMVA